MKNKPSVFLIIMLWSSIIILNIWILKTQISFKLDKIENNQKELIEIENNQKEIIEILKLKNGDV